MRSGFWTGTRLAVVGACLTVLASWAWSHRGDEWAKQLLRPSEPARAPIRFDNGSVRDSPRGAVPTDASTRSATLGIEDRIGVLKKCQKDGRVLYTDQVCPEGFKVAGVNGGKVNILPSAESKAATQKSPRQGSNALRDALDLSGNDRLKEKMMDAAINP